MRVNNNSVFIIDDDPVVCKALCVLFESVGFTVCTYKNAYTFLDNQDYKKDGCLIVDVRMPMLSGLQLIEELNKCKSTMPVIMITGYGDVQMAVRAMKLGAVDFILKPFNDQVLLESVQNIQKDVKNNNSLDKLILVDTVNKKLNQLSEREHTIIELIAKGKLNKEIAYMLNISTSTVEVHRSNIMKKLEVKNLAELLKMYIRYQIYTESFIEDLVE